MKEERTKEGNGLSPAEGVRRVKTKGARVTAGCQGPVRIKRMASARLKGTVPRPGRRLNLAGLWHFSVGLRSREHRSLRCSSRRQKREQATRDSSAQLTQML